MLVQRRRGGPAYWFNVSCVLVIEAEWAWAYKHEMLPQCWHDVGPASQTMGQHHSNTGSMFCFWWGAIFSSLLNNARISHNFLKLLIKKRKQYVVFGDWLQIIYNYCMACPTMSQPKVKAHVITENITTLYSVHVYTMKFGKHIF